MATLTLPLPSDRRQIRELAAGSRAGRYAFPIRIEPGNAAPRIAGTSWHYQTMAGEVIRHPLAYRAKGFRVRYCASTHTIIVGLSWLRRHGYAIEEVGR